MPKRLFALVSAFISVLAVCPAQPPTHKLIIPVQKASPWDGKQMYGSYCAPCHGADGRGTGPVAHSLRQAPTDLTSLARNNHGKYPDVHVLAALKFGTAKPAHGNAQMPVWGPVFSELNTHDSNEQRVRIFNLAKYIETLQVN